MREFDGSPFFNRLDAYQRLFSLGVMVAAGSTIDPDAAIEILAQNAGSPAPAAVDGIGAPYLTPRSRDSFIIEPLHDRLRRCSCYRLVKNAPDERGFIFIDFKQATDEFAIFANLPDHAIAVGAATCIQAATVRPFFPRLIRSARSLRKRFRSRDLIATKFDKLDAQPTLHLLI